VADVLTRFADIGKKAGLSPHEFGYSYGDYSEVIELGYVIDETCQLQQKRGRIMVDLKNHTIEHFITFAVGNRCEPHDGYRSRW